MRLVGFVEFISMLNIHLDLCVSLIRSWLCAFPAQQLDLGSSRSSYLIDSLLLSVEYMLLEVGTRL